MTELKLRKLFTITLILLLIGGLPPLIANDNFTNHNKILTLEDCIALAKKNNPQLTSQYYNISIARERLKEAKGKWLPTIWGNANYNRFSDGIMKNGADQNYNLSVQVSQPLFQSGELFSTIKKANYNSKAANFQYEYQTQDLVLEVNNAYFNYLKLLHLLEVAEKSLKQAKTNLEAAKERYKLGVARWGDIVKAEVKVSDAELNITRTRNNGLKSRGYLNKMIGFPINKPTRVKDSLAEKHLVFKSFDYNTLINQALNFLPEIKTFDMTIQAQKAAIKISKSEYLPSINLLGTYDWNGNAFSNLRYNWDVGISMGIPIFEGFTRKARVSEQQVRLKKLGKQKEELLENVKLEVWEAYLKVKETEVQIKNSKKHLKNAKENLRIAEGEYREGVNSMLELIDAQTSYIDAERTYINLLAEYRLSWAQMERKTGVIK